MINFKSLKQNPNPSMFIGAVKWFDNKKGFGTLALTLGEELFLHIRGFRNAPPEGVKPGEVIVGNKRPNLKREGYIALNCHVLGLPDDWEAILSLLGRPDTVLLPDRQRKDRRHSLMELAGAQLLHGMDADRIFTIVTAPFDNGIDPDLFIPYSAFLERVIIRSTDKGVGSEMLSRVFHHFGNRITHDVLFRVWKAAKFRYIGYNGQGDYEIPEDVLNLNATEIGYEELLRIRAYSFGPAFCSGFVGALLDGIESMGKEEIDTLIPYLDFLENKDREHWRNIVNS